MGKTKSQRHNVVFTLFGFSNEDSKGLNSDEGCIAFFGLGFRKDLERYTCIPRPLDGVGFYSKPGTRNIKRYPKRQEISLEDIPNDIPDFPRINDYFVYPLFQDPLATSLTSLSVKGKFIYNAFFYDRRIVFQRLGFQTELDCSSIPEDERFTLVLDWDTDNIGIWVSWQDNHGKVHTLENKIKFNEALDLDRIEQIRLQFFRLERHYNTTLSTKDPISFLDLAHCLRIWVDMKASIDLLLKQLDHQVEFRNTILNRKLKQILKGTSFKHIPLSIGVDSPNVIVKGLIMVEGNLNEEQKNTVYAMGPPTAQKTRLTFSEWLGAEIIESKTSTGKRLGISRSILIKRVANILGASHPQGSSQDHDEENRFDPYVRELHQHNVANGFPLTYYQLLEIAGEIINKIRPMWGNNA